MVTSERGSHEELQLHEVEERKRSIKGLEARLYMSNLVTLNPLFVQTSGQRSDGDPTGQL